MTVSAPIAVVDYDMGNLRSVQKALEGIGHRAIVTRDPGTLAAAAGMILPGVGAFGACMRNLERYGLVPPVRAHVEAGKPFLGICLGMQLLFSGSEEFGWVEGLGVLRGRVVRFTARPDLQVPHMGWNTLVIRRRAPHVRGIADGDHVYFVHSYYAVPEDPGVVATTTHYSVDFASSVWRDNVFACQFHPEKSQTVGLRILDNFAREVAASA